MCTDSGQAMHPIQLDTRIDSAQLLAVCEPSTQQIQHPATNQRLAGHDADQILSMTAGSI